MTPLRPLPPQPPRNDDTRPPAECEAAVRRLWDYLDGRLPDLAREEVEAHLAACAQCPPHFAFAREMRQALAASSGPAISDGDEAQLRERVRRTLQRLDAGAGGVGDGESDSRGGTTPAGTSGSSPV